jgi:hypothetical protein
MELIAQPTRNTAPASATRLVSQLICGCMTMADTLMKLSMHRPETTSELPSTRTCHGSWRWNCIQIAPALITTAGNHDASTIART